MVEPTRTTSEQPAVGSFINFGMAMICTGVHPISASPTGTNYVRWLPRRSKPSIDLLNPTYIAAVCTLEFAASMQGSPFEDLLSGDTVSNLLHIITYLLIWKIPFLFGKGLRVSRSSWGQGLTRCTHGICHSFTNSLPVRVRLTRNSATIWNHN